MRVLYVFWIQGLFFCWICDSPFLFLVFSSSLQSLFFFLQSKKFEFLQSTVYLLWVMYLMSSVRTLPGALVSFPGEWYLETEI